MGLCWPLRRAQDASKMAPKMKCGTFCDFDRILVHVGWIFGGFLVDFGSILVRFLVYFPSISGQVSGRCFVRFLIKCSAIFILLARFLVDCSSAVAGTQLCCALDIGYEKYWCGGPTCVRACGSTASTPPTRSNARPGRNNGLRACFVKIPD